MSEVLQAPLAPEQTVDLLQRAKGGDRAALEQLLARVMPRLQRWARGRLPAGARGMLETSDVVQDVVVSALRHVDSFEARGPGAFLAYLRQGVVNRLEDERRRVQRRPTQAELPADVMSDETSAVDRLVGSQNLQRYEAALAQLSDADQAALVGRFEWAYSYADLAVALGKPTPGAARAAVHRAVERLIAQIGLR